MKKFTLLVFIPLFFSCSDDPDVDVTAPEIRDFEVTLDDDHARLMEEESEIHAGEEAVVLALISDDEGVTSVKVDIHPAFDDHGHSRIAEEIGWTESFIMDGSNTTSLSGNPKNLDLHEHFDVPQYIYAKSMNNKQVGARWAEGEVVTSEDTIAIPEGEYHVVLYALDVNSNQSQEVVTVHVHNE